MAAMLDTPSMGKHHSNHGFLRLSRKAIFPLVVRVLHAKQDACSNGIASNQRLFTMTRKMKRGMSRTEMVSIIAWGDTEEERRNKRARRRGTLSLFKRERAA